jgi:transcriptional regulator with XRE-family HTH domain
MDMTQNELASVMGMSGQQVARYEKAENEIPGPVDTLMRIFYILSLVPEEKRSQFIQQIREGLAERDDVDEIAPPPAFFEASSKGWNDVVLAAACQ